MRFGSRTTVFTSGEGNGLISGDFCSVKILRHRRGSNTRSSLYESDALPLGHCALSLREKIIKNQPSTATALPESVFKILLTSSQLFAQSYRKKSLPLSRRSGQVVRRRSRKAKIACSTHVCASKFSPNENPWNWAHFPPLK